MHSSPSPPLDTDSDKWQTLLPSRIDAFTRSEFEFITMTVCKLPRYMNNLLFQHVAGNFSAKTVVTRNQFISFWTKFITRVSNPLRKTSLEIIIFELLKEQGSQYVSIDHLCVVIDNVIEKHPSLKCMTYYPNLKEEEKQELKTIREDYATTVLTFMFFEANCPHGTLGLKGLECIKFASTLFNLDSVNLADLKEFCELPRYSYFSMCQYFALSSHFKTMRDSEDALSTGRLQKEYRYHLNGLSLKRARLCSPTFGVRNGAAMTDTFDYKNFIWLYLCEIDKTTPAAIKFWFTCLDLDSVQVLTSRELFEFWKVAVRDPQSPRSLNRFRIVMEEVNDLVLPKKWSEFTLNDLMNCPPPVAERFFDTFLNFNLIWHAEWYKFTRRPTHSRTLYKEIERFYQWYDYKRKEDERKEAERKARQKLLQRKSKVESVDSEESSNESGSDDNEEEINENILEEIFANDTTVTSPIAHKSEEVLVHEDELDPDVLLREDILSELAMADAMVVETMIPETMEDVTFTDPSTDDTESMNIDVEKPESHRWKFGLI